MEHDDKTRQERSTSVASQDLPPLRPTVPAPTRQVNDSYLSSAEYAQDINDGIGDFNLFNRSNAPRPQSPPQETEDADAISPPQEQKEDEQPYLTNLERKRKRYYETQELVSSLEHIITIGAHNRHQQWRRNMWEKQTNNEATAALSDDDDDDEEEEKDDNPQRRPAHFLHAEDVRIYGHSEGFPARPWPSEYGKKRYFKVHHDMDAPWDLEHGDQINPIDFAGDVLSNIWPTRHAQENNDNNAFTHSMEMEELLDPTRMDQLDPKRMKVSPSPKQVPRAMLLRCWQRAVNAASFSILQQRPSTKSTVTTYQNLKDAPRLQQLQKPASERSVDLTVDMFPWATPANPPYICRLCGNDFETRQALKLHFHGTDQVRGCAWTEIHAKQREFIGKALLGEVESHTETLVRFVLTKARDRLNAMANEKEKKGKTTETSGPPEATRKLLNWKDALDIMKEALVSSEEYEDDNESDTDQEIPPSHKGDNKSSDSSPSGGPMCRVREVTKTLQVQQDMPPLVFNHQVMEAVSERLIDRYAPLPL